MSVIIIIIAACIFNLLWLMNFLSFERFLDERFSVSKWSSNSFTYKTEEYLLLVKRPNYPVLAGNLSISNEGGSIGIVAWPNFMCRQISEVGLILWDDESKIGYLVYVDDKMNLDKEKDTGLSENEWLAAKALYDDNYEIIGNMYTEMVTVFSIEE